MVCVSFFKCFFQIAVDEYGRALNFRCNIIMVIFNLFCVTFLFGNMTGIYTEYTLKALNKTQLIDLFLKMQDQTNSTIVSLMAEMKDLSSSFKRLESDVQIVKSVK